MERNLVQSLLNAKKIKIGDKTCSTFKYDGHTITTNVHPEKPFLELTDITIVEFEKKGNQWVKYLFSDDTVLQIFF